MKFTADHEWVEIEDGVATVGVTNYAQEQLGDVVFVELPEVGRSIAKGEAVGVVESVKVASDIFAPLSGQVAEINLVLTGDPSLVNTDPQSRAWFFKVKLSDPAELNALLDADTYRKLIA
ncbi:MAG: glycine cleavage system protein GcvH [Cucumibacter sp.]